MLEILSFWGDKFIRLLTTISDTSKKNKPLGKVLH